MCNFFFGSIFYFILKYVKNDKNLKPRNIKRRAIAAWATCSYASGWVLSTQYHPLPRLTPFPPANGFINLG